MPARKPKPDERPQSEDFIETARALGGDESRDAFERVFEKIARVKPSLLKDAKRTALQGAANGDEEGSKLHGTKV